MMEVPEEYGAAACRCSRGSIVTEGFSRSIALPARGEASPAPTVRGISTRFAGEMKEKYLCRCCAARSAPASAQTEPDAGSDPGGMRTTAVRDGDFYVIQRGQALHQRRQQGRFQCS